MLASQVLGHQGRQPAEPLPLGVYDEPARVLRSSEDTQPWKSDLLILLYFCACACAVRCRCFQSWPPPLTCT